MATYLSVPTKTTSDVDFSIPLRKYIKTHYPATKPEEYEKLFVDLNLLRAQAISKFSDKHETAISCVGRYYDQFCAVEKRLPFTQSLVPVYFTWFDAFAKATLLSTALQSQVAASQTQGTDDELKLTAKLFQQSAGIFTHLENSIMSYIGAQPTQDMLPDSFAALSSLMVAQAQESIYHKGAKDKMKDATVAKISMHCSVMYGQALELLQLTSVKDMWPREWLGVVNSKQAAFQALAEFHQAAAAKASKSFGEEISRLQQAKEIMHTALTRANKDIDYSGQLNLIDETLQKAKKDNDFIYHDRIPDYKSLEQVPEAAVAKASPMPSQFTSDFTDIFAGLQLRTGKEQGDSSCVVC